ncbi:MAG: LysM peptidoglycan-binding domain-containing protein [Planctomycetes bacterium]|nr:LysM peptidoglycan-binding domain-containing protein [Planctomycetota bacterium]
MKIFRHILLIATAAMAVTAGAPAQSSQPTQSTQPATVASDTAGQVRADRQTGQINPEIGLLSPAAMEDISDSITPDRIRPIAQQIWMGRNLSLSAREAGDKRAPIHKTIIEQLQSMSSAGVEYLGSIRSSAVVPVELDRIEPGRPPSNIRVGEKTWRLDPLRSNGPMPSICPAARLTGGLVYAGRGEWQELDGLPLAGAIALMEYSGGGNWRRLFSLGCQAIVVLEDKIVNRRSADELSDPLPLPVPRFLATGRAARELREAGLGVNSIRRQAAALRQAGELAGQVGELVLLGKNLSAQAESLARSARCGESCTLYGGSDWQERICESIFAYLPPGKCATYAVQPDDLAGRLARDYGVGLSEMKRLAANAAISPGRADWSDLPAGTMLELPGGGRYVVRHNDLLERIAKQYDVRTEDIVKANNLRDPAAPYAALPELAGGKALVIPNLEGSILLTARIDSDSASPDADNGGKTAANVALALKTLRTLAESKNIQRRRGIIVAFVDGQSCGDSGLRELARSALGAGDSAAMAGASQGRRLGAGAFLIILLAALAGGGAWQCLRSRGGEGRGSYKAAVAGLAAAVAVAAIIFFLPAGGPASQPRIDAKTLIRHCRSAAEYFRSGGTADLSQEDAAWLGESWLTPAIDCRRAELAEKIFTGSPARADGDASLLDDLRQKLYGEGGWRQRVAGFYRALAQAEQKSPRGARLAISLAELGWQLQAEMDGLLRGQAMRDNNVRVARSILCRLHGEEFDGVPKHPSGGAVGLYLDISDGQDVMAIRCGEKIADGRSPAARLAGRCLAAAQECDRRFGGSPIDTRGRLGVAVTSDDAPPPVDRRYFEAIGVRMIALDTVGDEQPRLGTHADTLENLDLDNFCRQGRLAGAMTAVACSRQLADPSDRIDAPEISTVSGRVVRSGDRGKWAGLPVAGAIVFASTSGGAGLPTIAGPDGRFDLGLHPAGDGIVLSAYRLDRSTGLFDMVLDAGALQGRDKIRLAVNPGPSFAAMPMTPCYPLAIFHGSDPLDNQPLAGRIKLIDAAGGSQPARFGLDVPDVSHSGPGGFNRPDYQACVAYLPAGKSVRVEVRSGDSARLILTGADGAGYPVGPIRDSLARQLDRNISLPLGSLLVAGDMLRACESESRRLAQKGLVDASSGRALRTAADKMGKASKSAAEFRWSLADSQARGAWALTINAWNELAGLRKGAVVSAVILLILLAVASAFLERLIFGAAGVVRLAAGMAIFIILAAAAWQVHPAFGVSDRSWLLLPACALAALCLAAASGLAADLRTSRETGSPRRKQAGPAMQAGTLTWLAVGCLRRRPGRAALSAFVAAMMTLVILAFVSVGDERSYRIERAGGQEKADGQDKTGKPAAKTDGPAGGLLFTRSLSGNLDSPAIESIRAETGGAKTSLRAVRFAGGFENDGRTFIVEHAGRKHALDGLVAMEAAEADLTGLNKAVCGHSWFDAADRPGRSGNPAVIILPDSCADSLGIDESQLYEPLTEMVRRGQSLQTLAAKHRVRLTTILRSNSLSTSDLEQRKDPQGGSPYLILRIDRELKVPSGRLKDAASLPSVVLREIGGMKLSVGGILFCEKADALTDITGVNLSASAGGADKAGHAGWSRLAIVSMELAGPAGAGFASLAVRFDDGRDVKQFLEQAASLSQPVRADLGDGPVIIRPQHARTVGGLDKAAVPIILCILAAIASALSSLDDRRGLMEMLRSAGAGPRQIAMLPTLEAAITWTIGVAAGLLGGLALAKIAMYDLPVVGILAEGLSVNIAGLLPAVLAIAVLAIGPAITAVACRMGRRTSTSASASGGAGRQRDYWHVQTDAGGTMICRAPFRVTAGGAIAATAFLERFLMSHRTADAETFTCGDLNVAAGGQRQTFGLEARMAISPYDQQISQQVSMEFSRSGETGLYDFGIKITHLEGPAETWLAANHRLLDLIRNQFLAWAGLNDDEKMRLAAAGEELLKQQPTHG